MNERVFGPTRKLSSYLGLLVLVTLMVFPAFADPVIKPTSRGTINVSFATDPATPNPGDQTQLKVSFLNKQTNSIQPHIDYKVSIMEGNNQVFGIPITHTAEGQVSIPFQFQDAGTYRITVEVDGILFQPIPPETAVFSTEIGRTGSPDNNTATPEFGPLASLVLVIAIISTVIITSKIRTLPKI
jgi:predicted secreted protein with PEFG-CTERM motif